MAKLTDIQIDEWNCSFLNFVITRTICKDPWGRLGRYISVKLTQCPCMCYSEIISSSDWFVGALVGDYKSGIAYAHVISDPRCHRHDGPSVGLSTPRAPPKLKYQNFQKNIGRNGSVFVSELAHILHECFNIDFQLSPHSRRQPGALTRSLNLIHYFLSLLDLEHYFRLPMIFPSSSVLCPSRRCRSFVCPSVP